MLILLAMACATDSLNPQIVVDLENAIKISGAKNDLQFGAALAAGSDIDHNGRAEWIVGAPHIPEEFKKYQAVRVYEGRSLALSRHPAHDDRPDHHGSFVSAGFDFNEDGYPDAAFSTDAISMVTPPRMTILSGDSRGDLFLELVDEARDRPVLDIMLGDGFAIAGTVYRWDLATSDMWEKSRYVTSGPETLIDANEPPLRYPGTTNLLGSDDDRFLVGFWTPKEPVSGSTYICPAALDIDVPESCELVAEGEGVGGYQIGGDLDGDGAPEVITSEVAANGTHGSASIYKLDGTLLARIEGTHNAMFGRNPNYVVDDDGKPWLLVGQTHLSGDGPPTIWGFRGDQLKGDLVDTDALRIWEGLASRFGIAMTTYRELPGDPLQLLIGSPDENLVYIVAFDPKYAQFVQ